MKKKLQKKLLYFGNIIFKGYGQVAICLNTFSGCLVSAAIFYLSRVIWLLTLLAVVSSTITAFIIRARPFHINAGIYGFNGVILGVAWLWFLKMNITSIFLLVITASLSSVLMKLLIGINLQTKINLPIFSIPSIILIWLIFILLRYAFPYNNLTGPDAQINNYLQIYNSNFISLNHYATLGMFLKVFYRHIIALLIIFLGIMIHSRISAIFSLLSFLVTIIMVYYLGGRYELINIDLYLYNAIPCAISLGGTFLVLNRKVFLLTILAVVMVIWTIFIGIRHFAFPVFVAPFNLFTILFLWVVKSNFLKRDHGFFAVPMDFISNPEFSLQWYKGEQYADNYWREIEKLSYERTDK